MEKKKEIAGALAFLVWGLWVHRFYLEQYLQGTLYIAFSWTFIPAILGIVESIQFFTMKEEKFNELYKKLEK